MPGIATSNKSEYLPETGGDVPVPVPTTLMVEDSSNITDATAAPTAVKDELMNMRLEEKAYGKYVTSSTSDVSLEKQPTMLESFLWALKSCHHDSYAVSTGWLSSLEEYERKELETVLSEAGYTRIHEESSTTTFERMRDDERHPATNLCNDPLSTSAKAPVGANDTAKDSASGSGGLLRNDKLKRKLDNYDSTSESFGLVSTVERGRTEDGRCQPQVLKVTTIPSTSSSLCTEYKLYRRQQLGDTVVTMLKKGTSQPISTTMDKLFPMTTVEFAQDNSTCKEVRLTAGATTTISCCFKINHDSRKIRLKFSKISGGVRNERTASQKRCNALVLGSLSTNVYACINDEEVEIESQENESEEINLKLEHGRREVGKFEWLQTRRNPANCEPGSITLELRGHIRQRCKADLGQAQRAHELHFEEGEGGPVVLEGNLPRAQRQKWFLELNVRYQLEVSYIKPCTPVCGKARFVSGRRVTEVIDFDCYLVFTTNEFSLD